MDENNLVIDAKKSTGLNAKATTSASGFTDADQRHVSQSSPYRPESWRVHRR